MNAKIEMPVPAAQPVSSNLPECDIQILLVDDDLAFRQVLQRLLTEEGYSVLTADSGTEVLETVETLKIHLILLNLTLPDDDGLETLEQLMLEHPLLPIILIAAHPNQFFPALALGVGAMLEKPLDFVELFQTIHQLLAESDEIRLARIAQQPEMFHFIPARNAGAIESVRH